MYYIVFARVFNKRDTRAAKCNTIKNRGENRHLTRSGKTDIVIFYQTILFGFASENWVTCFARESTRKYSTIIIIV